MADKIRNRIIEYTRSLPRRVNYQEARSARGDFDRWLIDHGFSWDPRYTQDLKAFSRSSYRHAFLGILREARRIRDRDYISSIAKDDNLMKLQLDAEKVIGFTRLNLTKLESIYLVLNAAGM